MTIAFATGCVGVAWVPLGVSLGLFAAGLRAGRFLGVLAECVRASPVSCWLFVYTFGYEVARTRGTLEHTPHAPSTRTLYVGRRGLTC